ncbi:replication initiation protein [Rhodoblastus sp.]|uniref:replication initiation protein n=1 Tax=Rhodoblastus sp. TaxID=1962975 RepID=UPI003FD784CF
MFDTESPQLPVTTKQRPRTTGDLWNPSAANPTTVPVPLPVVVVRVDGPFTALDRKLWLALVHIAFPDLDKPGKIHEILISEIIDLFRRVGGRRDLGAKGTLQLTKKLSENTEAATLWQSIRRLAKTTIEWEDDDYMGINSLLGARMDKDARNSGKLYFTFDPLLAQHVLAPRAWARLNVHVVMKLRSKYAVTLYEILEAYANRENKTCTATIDELRAWLKVPDDAYQSWKDFRRNVVDIAVEEINTYADLAGFSVEYEGIREGKAFTKIKFTVAKTDGRQERETMLGRKAVIHKRRARAIAGLADPDNPPMPSGDALDAFRRKWPGNDPYEVIGLFQDKWRGAGCTVIRSPDGAFLKFAEGMFKARAKKGRVAA